MESSVLNNFGTCQASKNIPQQETDDKQNIYTTVERFYTLYFSHNCVYMGCGGGRESFVNFFTS